MALTTSDLQQIRTIVFEGMQATIDALDPRFETLEQGQKNLEQGQTEANRRLGGLEQRFDIFDGRLEAVENDIRELYYSI